VKITQNNKNERELTLLKMAGDEEKDYNWVKAAKLYTQASKSYSKKK
jgi:hypothetical protein